MSVARRAYLFLCSDAVVFTLLIVAVVYGAGRTLGFEIDSWVSVIWFCPSCASNVSTEFRETLRGIREDVAISNPSGDSGRCRSVFRGMPITRSGMMAITIPG